MRLLLLHSNARHFATRSADRATSFCPYKTLNVTKTADLASIKKAYYAKVFTLHPDRLAAQPGGAPKPGSKEHKLKTAEFVQTVKSFELLSDEKRRKEYDLDAARGDTMRYANEAQGKSPDAGSSKWKANYNWDPRENNPYGKTGAQGYGFGAEYDVYYGPMNKGPIYGPNWMIALGVIGVAVIGCAGILSITMDRIRQNGEVLAMRDQMLEIYYDKKKKEAQERGFQASIERIRALDVSPASSSNQSPK